MSPAPERPAGPRRPPRPEAGAGSRPARAEQVPAKKASAKKAPAKKAPAKKAPKKKVPAGKAPVSAGPTGSSPAAGRAGGKRPIPSAPGPRPEPAVRRARSARPAPGPSGATIRPTEARPRPKPAAPAPAPATPAPAAGRRGRRPPRIVPDDTQVPAPPRSAFRQRFGVPYDTQGPRVRLGVLWAVAVVAALAPQGLRPFGLAVVYAVVAGFAAAQIIDAYRGEGADTDRLVALFAASALPVVATTGARPLGFAILATVVAAVVAATTSSDGQRPVIARAGHTVAAAVVCGGAAASLVLLADYEIGAVIILLVYVMVYDASDFVIGSGATNGIEGPLAGWLFIAATTLIFAVVNAPPFRGIDTWAFALLAMVACPLGQVLASALLPTAATRAPALRRLDSLLVVAPAWAGLVGLYLQNAGG